MRDLRRIRGILGRGAVAGAIVLGSIGLAAAPASAQAVITGWAAGPVGVPQTIVITGIAQPIAGGLCTDQSEPFNATINGVPQTQINTNVVNGNATITFIPAIAGAASWSFGSGESVGGCEVVQGTAMSITQTSTVTVVSAPNTAATGQSTVINVLVTSAGTSQYVPTGSVRLNTGFGVNINTMGLTPSWSGNTINAQAPPGATRNSSFAFLRWTPPADGTYTFQAVYSGDANAVTSTSQVDSLLATPTGGTIAFHAPATATVGVPMAMSASIFPANSAGSAGFTLNGAAISASVPFVNGVANFTWTPTAAGNFTLGVNYMTNDGRSGSTSQALVVVAGPVQTDQITLVQPGFGAWSPNGVYTLGNGTAFTFQTSTLSGAAVTLTDTGPCNLSGNNLVIDTGAGQCNIVASSPGGAGFAPVKVGYTILMVPGTQTARLAAPANGSSFQRGRTVRLENPAQGQTNAGQTIQWRVQPNSRNICRLRFPANGAVNVQLQRAGNCNLRATAPAVPNAWNAFNLALRYRVR